jgi:hypothetical protein
VLGDAKQIAAKTKNMEDMTGFFKTKFTGKQESVKNVLSAVSVNMIFLRKRLNLNTIAFENRVGAA